MLDTREFIKNLEKKFSGDLYKDLEVSVTSNVKKIRDNAVSISILISTPDKDKKIDGTIIVITHGKFTTISFINNYNKDVVFTNTSIDPLEKAEKYITRYVERSVSRMMGYQLDGETVENK